MTKVLARPVSAILTVMLVIAMLATGLSPVGATAHPGDGVCGTQTVVTLFGGQTIDTGTVTVSNDGENLFVTFTTTGGWLLVETHLAVATSLEDIPQTKKGNPKVGQFPYQCSYDPPVTEDTYVISLADNGWSVGTELFIAAHAVVVQLDGSGEVIEEETGWADGGDFPGRNWATWLNYIVQACEEPLNGGGGGETETAFAYGDNLATCFLDIDED